MTTSLLSIQGSTSSLFRIMKKDLPVDYFKVEEYIRMKGEDNSEELSDVPTELSESDSSNSNLYGDFENLEI